MQYAIYEEREGSVVELRRKKKLLFKDESTVQFASSRYLFEIRKWK